MRWLRSRLDRIAPHFEHGGRLHKWHPLWEAADTFFYSPSSVTGTAAHVRDAIDLKRIMMTVVIATLPCVLMAIFNTGLQANLAIDPAKAASLEGWRHDVIRWLGTGYSPRSAVADLVHGALYFLPLYIVTMVVGLTWEVLFAIVRKVEVNEGFFVTGILFPLILPPTTPLWQAALGISFGVVIAKEVFGGTGMNFINPALAARAFVFFAYPAAISGDKVWTAVPAGAAVDGFSGATLLGQMRGDDAALRDRRLLLVARLPRLRARLDGRDVGARLPDRRGDHRGDQGGFVAHHGRRRARHDRDGAAVQRDRVADQPVVRGAVLVAHGAGRLGLRHRLHGDRPGDGAVRREGQAGSTAS